MRTPIRFIKDISTQLPLLFPMVALFHLFYLCQTVYSCIAEPFPSLIWLQSVYALLYAFFWFMVCDLRRWASWGYIGVTCVNIALMVFLRQKHNGELFYASLVPADALFVFFILYYYKRFR